MVELLPVASVSLYLRDNKICRNGICGIRDQQMRSLLLQNRHVTSYSKLVTSPVYKSCFRLPRHPPGIGSLLIACYRSGGFLAATLASNGGPDECHGVGSAQVYLRGRALLAVGLGDLPDKGSPRHIKRVVDCGCFRPRVVLQYLNHQGGVIRHELARP